MYRSRQAKANSRRLAAIDLGTNTILLLIAEISKKGTFKVLEDLATITRLGEGVDRTRRIGAAGARRSLAVLRRYVRRCRDLRVGEIIAVGTSALRDARNAGEFKARVKRETGLELSALSGQEEARYAYLAVQKGLDLGKAGVLVVDVGGGSTELIRGNYRKAERVASLDLGSVRLTERFLRADPARPAEVRRLVARIDRALESALKSWRRRGAPENLVGIAGTFTTLAAIQRGLKRYSHSEVHGCDLSRAELQRQIALLAARTVAQRKKIPGLEPSRADVILAGALLIDRIMEFFRAERATVSDHGVRYGLIHERVDR